MTEQMLPPPRPPQPPWPTEQHGPPSQPVEQPYDPYAASLTAPAPAVVGPGVSLPAVSGPSEMTYAPAFAAGPQWDVPMLTLEGVDAGYGAFRAIFDVSLTIPTGAAVALLGPNGAGKTTVARVASGLVKPTAGRLLLGHQDVTGMAAHEIARLGVSHAPEGRSIFATLTVEENLLLEFRRSLDKAHVNDALERAYTAFPRLRERRGQIAGTMSGGEQRMLSLARVLANPPRLVIADELSLGLAPIIVDEVFATLEAIRSAGVTLLIIEQHAHKALEIADKAVLLRKGRVVYDGPVDEMGDLAAQLIPGM